MSYLFTLPKEMMAFISTGSSSKTLFRTSRVFHSGEVIKISEIAVMEYGDRNQLTLRLYRNNLFLLVEEIGDEIRELACAWTKRYEETHDERTSTETIHDRLAPLLQRHIQRESRIVFDEKGPGVHFVL